MTNGVLTASQADATDLAHFLFDTFSGSGRSDVDLVEKSAITNPFRRKAILSGREVLYAA